jgi:hypothetical protein
VTTPGSDLTSEASDKGWMRRFPCRFESDTPNKNRPTLNRIALSG